jgi:hypothetical protein
MAEGVGFEPTRERKPPAGFQDRCLKPLGHPSNSARSDTDNQTENSLATETALDPRTEESMRSGGRRFHNRYTPSAALNVGTGTSSGPGSARNI